MASYLLRFVELGAGKGNHDPEARFLSWENTVLVKARDLDHAYDKVAQIGKEASEPYKGGPESVAVQWRFEGITEILPIYEEIEDGAEIMWSERAPRKLKSLRKLVRKKGQFHQ